MGLGSGNYAVGRVEHYNMTNADFGDITKCEYGKKQIPKYGRRKGNGGRICARNKFGRLIGKARFYPSAAQHLMSCCP
jgi:hypothetical protein